MFYISIGFAQKLCRTHMYKLYIYVGVPYYLHMALKYQVAWCHEMIENRNDNFFYQPGGSKTNPSSSKTFSFLPKRPTSSWSWKYWEYSCPWVGRYNSLAQNIHLTLHILTPIQSSIQNLFRLGPENTLMGERRHKDEVDSADDSDGARAEQEEVDKKFEWILLQLILIRLL